MLWTTLLLAAFPILVAAQCTCPTATGTVGEQYNSAISNLWNFTSLSLPTGLAYQNGMCRVFGTPTQAGTYSFSFECGNTCILFKKRRQLRQHSIAKRLTCSITIKQPQTIIVLSTPPVLPLYGDEYNATATASSELPVTVSVDPSTPNSCSIIGGVVKFFHISFTTCVLNFNQAGDDTFSAAPQVQQTIQLGATTTSQTTTTVAPTQGPQSISITSTPPNLPLYGTNYTATATASSGLPVTIWVDFSTPNSCVVLSGTVSPVVIGFFHDSSFTTCILNFDQSGDASYQEAPRVKQTIELGVTTTTMATSTAAPVTTTTADTTTTTTAASVTTTSTADTTTTSTAAPVMTTADPTTTTTAADPTTTTTDPTTTTPASTSSTVAPTSTTVSLTTTSAVVPTTTISLEANDVVLTIVLSDPPTQAQIDSIIAIFSTLTGLPASAFSVVVLSTRADTSVEVQVTDQNAGAASNTIKTTLESNSTFLTTQDSSLPEVRSVTVTSSSSPSTVNVVAIVVPIVVVVALVAVGIILFFVVRRKRSHRQEIELAAQANPGFGMPL